MVREGVCINKLRCQSVRTGLFLRTLITFESDHPTKLLPSHKITVGDIVAVQTTARIFLFTGVVYSLSSSAICIAVDKESDAQIDQDGQTVMVMKISNNVTHRRLKKALQDLRNYPIGGCSHNLIEFIFGNKEPGAPLNVDKIDYFNSNLNESQKEAVELAISSKELAIIHGPPGTGKTTTLVEIILQLRKAGHKILVCAPSNIAIDNLVEKVSSYKVKDLVRLGHPARASSDLQKYTLDAIVGRSDAKDLVNDIRSEIEEVRKSRNRHKRDELRDLMKDLKNREKSIVKNVLTSAKIIFSTLVSASREGPLKHIIKDIDHKPDILIIDECSQALEASCWIAIPLVTKCILAGDHHQLPPTIISEEAAENGLAITLMEKCLYRLKNYNIVKMLNIQYRMHQSIMEWSSKSFYSGDLIADESVKLHTLKDLVPALSECPPLLLIDTAGCDMPELDLKDEESKGNENEADIVAGYVTNLVNKGVNPSLIGIITPYNLQVELLRLRLSSSFPSLEIKSVDGFQGREKEVIILSLVRSNENKEAGFLSEYRRINVAVTRAKRHLAVVCDSETVSSEPHLESFIKYIHEKGEVEFAHNYESMSSQFKDIERPQHLRFKDRLQKSQSPQKKAREEKGREGQQESHQKEIKSKLNDKKSLIKSEQDKALIKIINDKIESFARSNKKELTLPSTMTSYERFLVHEIAEKLNLNHASQGDGDQRYIVLRKPNLTTNSLHDEVKCPSNTLDSKKKVLQTDEKNDVPMLIENQEQEEPEEDNSTIQVEKVKIVKEKKKKKKKKENDKKVPQNVVNAESLKAAKETKKESLTKAKNLNETLEGLEDFDEILEAVKSCDNVCFYVNCKKKTTTFGQDCRFCKRRFCHPHAMYEVHGCGQAVKTYARSITRREGKIYPGLSVPNHKPDPRTRAELEKKFNKKMEDIVAKRKPKKEEKE